MGSAASTASHLVTRERKIRTLLFRYGDAKGEVHDLFKAMKVPRNLRLSWLQRWQSMDDDGSKLVDYREFSHGCGLEDNLWSRRMFNLLDKNFTGCIDFYAFIRSLPRLLVYDRSNAVEVAFRMCSRRGATCNIESAVLDEKDMRYFVEQRYPPLDRQRALHRASSILKHLDEDESAGVTFAEFVKFCDMNLVFLTAVHKTVQCMRESIFGEMFWKEFTKTARMFDQPARDDIFCSIHQDNPPLDPTLGPGKPTSKGGNSGAQAEVSQNTRKENRKADEMTFAAQAAMGKLRKIASESSIALLNVARDRSGVNSITGADFAMDKVSSWASSAKGTVRKELEAISSKAKTASSSIRRVASDSRLIKKIPVRRDEAGQLKRGLLGALDQALSIEATDIQRSFRSAGRRVARSLEEHAHGISQVGVLVREKSTLGLDRTRELLEVDKDILSKTMAAITATAKAGQLKAVMTAIMVTQKLQEIDAHKGVATNARIGGASSGLRMPTLARHLPDTGSIRAAGSRVSQEAKVRGAGAREVLQRSVRLINVARYLSEGLGRSQHQPAGRRALEAMKRSARVTISSRYMRYEQKINQHPTRTATAEGRAYLERLPEGGEYVRSPDAPPDSEVVVLGEDGEIMEDDNDAWELASCGTVDESSLKKPGAKSDARHGEDRRWAMTLQFYDRLATAAARLEAKRTSDKGYDFSADFPKLWGTVHVHGGHTTGDVLREQKKLRMSAAKKTANMYMRFISIWQDAGLGRSKLEAAFVRWRLQTCDAAMDESRSEKPRMCETSPSSVLYTPSCDVQIVQRRQTQTIAAMWDEAGGSSGRQQIFCELILRKERADRLLPSELCDAYERDMVQRINQRQTNRNVPIAMPFC